MDQRGLEIGSINSTLRVLRRIIRLSIEWGVLDTAPKFQLLTGERRRERVVTVAEEAQYLAALFGVIEDKLGNTLPQLRACVLISWIHSAPWLRTADANSVRHH